MALEFVAEKTNWSQGVTMDVNAASKNDWGPLNNRGYGMEAIYGSVDQDYNFWDNKTWQVGTGEMHQSLTPAAGENGVSSNNMFTSTILFGKLRI